jgi:hypothetical protein
MYEKILNKSLTDISRGLVFSLVLFLSSNILTAQSIAINEIMASNASTITDENGDYEDWIELYNFGPEPISLYGYGFSDDSQNPFRWVFPGISIQPGEFMLIWTSGKDRTDPDLPLHTNFSLSASGEVIVLTSPDSTTIDEILPIVISTDISYGRQPDGTGERLFFNEPTPGESNSTNAYSEILNPPVFSHPGGFYTSAFELNITHPDPDVTILFTLDGSEPDTGNLEGTTYNYKKQYPENPDDPFGNFYTNSYQTNIYSDPIIITERSNEPDKLTNIASTWRFNPYHFPSDPVFKGTVIRAIALKEGAIKSHPVTCSYFIDTNNDEPYSLSIISLSTNERFFFCYESGVYVAGIDFDNWRTNNPLASAMWYTPANYRRNGDEWEYPVHLEIFTNHESVFSQDVGFSIHGGWARQLPAKSIRIYARNIYSKPSIDFPLFPHLEYGSFKRFIIRHSGQDWPRTLLRDATFQTIVSHLNFDTQAYEPVILFINAEYWGIHNIRERYDKHYLERVYAINPDNIDLLESNRQVNEGDAVHYNQMLNYMDTADLSVPSHYEYIKTQMDVVNYLDYQIAEIYSSNDDWPGNNIRYWRLKTDTYEPHAPYGHDGRWRWMMFDMDGGFGHSGGGQGYAVNSLAIATEENGPDWPNPPYSTFIFRRLLSNNEFRHQFINRFADLLNTTFLPDRMISIVDSLKERIEPEIPQHVKRWNRPVSLNAWRDDVNTMVLFATHRPYYQRNHITAHFALEGEYNLDLNVSNNWHGHIRVNTIDIKNGTPGISANPYPWTGIYFKGIPIELEAIPATGFAFSHWEGLPEGSPATVILTPEEDIHISAVFERVIKPELIFFWLFDTELPNNTPLEEVNAIFQLPGDGVIQFHSALDGYPFDPDHQNWRKASMERRNEPTEINYHPEGNNGALYPDTDMRGLQVKQPFKGNFSENELIFTLPSTGYKELLFSFAAKDEGAAEYLVIDYSITPDPEWIINGLTTDTFLLMENYQLFEVDFNEIETVDDNPDFKIRMRFGGSDMTADEGNRVTFNNFSLDGKSLAGFNLPPLVENPVDFHELIESGENLHIDLDLVFYDPDDDTLVFSAYTDNPEMLDLNIEDGILAISPIRQGGTNITMVAVDGYNSPVSNTFRVLIYPEAHRFGTENFTFTDWDANEHENNYPEHMLFIQSDVNDPDLTEQLLFPYYIPHNDYHADDQNTIGFPYNNTSRTRITGLNEAGISFINTGRERDLGGALLAIDTRGVTSANLSWLAGTILENSRAYALRLQYRTDINEPFSDLLINYEPLEYLTATDGDIVEFESIALPPEILEKKYVQLLWRYYHISGDSGPRAQLRLDDIVFSEVIGIPAIDEEILKIYPHGNSIFIEMPGNIESVLHVYDLAGRLILGRQLSGKAQHKINFSSGKGIYIVRLITPHMAYSRKIMMY